MLGYFSQLRNDGPVSQSPHYESYRLMLAMLRELRREKKVTQEALADLLGKPQSYVSKYELGERRIDVVETFAVCRALNADFASFVKELISRIESRGGSNVAGPRNRRHVRRSDNT
jgi:transcriptional regulator with XRE-family HTH domain